MPQVLTANRLKPGAVVYWNQASGWVDRLKDASPMAESDAEATLKNAAEWVRKREVVGTYLFAVTVEDGGAIVPLKMREVIRARGPSVRTDLGKQAF